MSGLSRVKTEAQHNECSRCELQLEFVTLSLELPCFLLSRSCVEHQTFHRVHFPVTERLDFPSPASYEQSLEPPTTIWALSGC